MLVVRQVGRAGQVGGTGGTSEMRCAWRPLGAGSNAVVAPTCRTLTRAAWPAPVTTPPSVESGSEPDAPAAMPVLLRRLRSGSTAVGR